MVPIHDVMNQGWPAMVHRQLQGLAPPGSARIQPCLPPPLPPGGRHGPGADHPGEVSLNPRSCTTDGRDPRDTQGPAGIRTKAPLSPRLALHLERDPVKILNEDKLRAAIPLGNALRNSPPCVPAIGHLRMPRRANSHQFVRYRGPRIADAIQGPGLSLGEAIMIASTAHFGVARPA